MTETEAIAQVYDQYIKYNPTLIDCVNKGAKSLDVFKNQVYQWMDGKIPSEYQDECYIELFNAAWDYDILTPFIRDNGAISDISCHAWDNIWLQKYGKWYKAPYTFRSPDHYDRFYSHACFMNSITSSERNAAVNCTDLTTCADFRLRLNYVHHSINTDGSNVFSIRKIPTNKKTLEYLTRPEEGMLTAEMIPIVLKHLKEAKGALIVGMGGSGKTTFLNAILECLPPSLKMLIIQENEELFLSSPNPNADFLKTVQSQNQYGVSHDLNYIARNGLLMSIGCFVIGEIKGSEAQWIRKAATSGAKFLGTLHADSSRTGINQLISYMKEATDYSKQQCMQELTSINKVIFLDHYRLREITTIHGYNFEREDLDMETEYFNPNPVSA